MVAAISGDASIDPSKTKTYSQAQHQQQNQDQKSPRPPLLPSEKDNGFAQRRPKGRQVSSRYMSPSSSTSTSSSATSSSSRRCPSPLISRSTNLTPAPTPLPSKVPKRSQSVDRKRPSTPRSVTLLPDSRQGNASETTAAAKLLVTSSRSLSVSFQGEAFSLPISKTKAATPTLSNARKATPERRRSTPVRRKGEGDQVENSKPIEQHRWPARTRESNSCSNPLSRSLGCSNGHNKLTGNGYGKVIMALQDSMIYDTRRSSFDGRISLNLGNGETLMAAEQNPDGNSGKESTLHFDLMASDSESVSSGSTTEVQGSAVISKERSEPRGIVVRARLWQQTDSLLRRFQDPGSLLLTSPSSKMSVPAKFSQSKKFSSDDSSSSPRTAASPMRGAARPASPSKLCASSASSSLRGISSPARGRTSVTGQLNGSYCSAPSVLSFSADIWRGKVGHDRFIDAHMLRLLYNRYLQWRFVNARADTSLMVQRVAVERLLWNSWVAISELRHSVTLKRMKLLLLRQKLKLTSIIRGQIPHLEKWALLNVDHCSSLLGATEALSASTLRLPIIEETIADVQSLKEALSSAIDTMQSVASSIYTLSTKVEEINSLVAELVKVTADEKVFLEHGKELLCSLASMQVKDCSLRTHIIQFTRESTTNYLTTHV